MLQVSMGTGASAAASEEALAWPPRQPWQLNIENLITWFVRPCTCSPASTHASMATFLNGLSSLCFFGSCATIRNLDWETVDVSICSSFCTQSWIERFVKCLLCKRGDDESVSIQYLFHNN